MSQLLDDAMRSRDVFEALTTLNPQEIEHARRTMPDDSRPLYSPVKTTASDDSDDTVDRDRRFECDKLQRELEKTRPSCQYSRAVRLELDVMEEAERMYRFLDPTLFPFQQLAEAVVRERWIERGIWSFGDGRVGFLAKWKHTLADERNSKAKNTKAKNTHHIGTVFDCGPDKKVVKKDTEPIPLSNNVDASRPYSQFEWESSEERKMLGAGGDVNKILDFTYKKVMEKWESQGRWTSKCTKRPEHDLAVAKYQRWLMKVSQPCPDINSLETVAYNNVRADWEKHGLWDQSWTEKPGAIWRHEWPEEKARLQQLGGGG
ncbi:hypothetical protein MMC07_009298 [Pseudocyphellaria aurata]|nr:hypothetical protein [Pseudocyphellaria aurata]